MKHDVHNMPMPQFKLIKLGRTFLMTSCVLALGLPWAALAQEESNDFFGNFDKPIGSIRPDGSIEDAAGAPNEEPLPPAVEELAVDILTSGEKHPSQNIHNELTDADAFKTFLRNHRSRLTDILTMGEYSPEAVQVIEESMKQMLYSLTVKEHQKSDESNKIYQEIYRFFVNRAGENLAPLQRQQYREQVYARLLPILEELLQQNYFVRLRAAILLSDLDLKIGDSRNGITPIPYRGAVDLALKTVADDEQPVAVKICCLRSLHKGLKYGNFVKPYRLKIALTCIEELLEPSVSWWYHRELVRCLEVAEIDTNDEGLPVVVNTLAVVLSDPTRHHMVRSQAAHALGRVPLTPAMQINVELLVYEILNLSVSMAEERNQLIDDYANRKVPAAFMSRWALYYANVYLAYQPLNMEEKNAGAGLLQKVSRPGVSDDQTQVKETYARTKPFFNFLLNEQNFNTKFPSTLIDSGKTWLEEYPPSDLKVAPMMAPLVGLKN